MNKRTRRMLRWPLSSKMLSLVDFEGRIACLFDLVRARGTTFANKSFGLANFFVKHFDLRDCFGGVNRCYVEMF